MAKLSSLVVDLQLQSAQLRTGLDQANKKLDAFAKHAEGVGSLLKEAFSFEFAKEAVEKLGEFVMHGAEAAAQMGKLAQSVGAPVEELSKLDYAATLSGTSTEQLGIALGHLSKKMADALSGGAESAAVFRDLGVSITDSSGNLRSSSEVMKDVAKAFAGLQDGAAKSAVAQELFGKSGAALIPMLDRGRDGLAALGDEAERFGLVVSEQGAASAEEFNIALAKLHKLVDGVAMRVAEQLSPALTGLVDDLLETTKQTGGLNQAVEILSGTIRVLVSSGIVVSGVFRGLADSLAASGAVIAHLVTGDFAGAQAIEERLGDLLRKNAEETKRRLDIAWDKNPPKGPGDWAEQHQERARRALHRTEKAAEDAAKKMAALNEENFKSDNQGGLEKWADDKKGGVALDKTKRGISAGMATRRGEFLGVNPMAGFAGFDDAVSKAGAALRKEADLREEVRKLERDKGFEAAERLSELADQAHAAGMAAEKAADAFSHAAEAQRAARQALLDKVTPKGVGDLINAGQQGSVAAGGSGLAGAFGAVGGVVLELLTKSKQFGQVMEKVDAVVQSFADVVGIVLEPLFPVLDALGHVAKSLTPIFKLLGDAVGAVLKFIFGFWNAIVDALNSLTKLFGTDISDWKVNLDALHTSTGDAANSTDKLASAAEKAAESLSNVPTGYKVALNRFNAMNAGHDPEATPAGGGTSVTHVTINATTLDPDELAALYERIQRLAEIRRTGRSYPSAGRYALDGP